MATSMQVHLVAMGENMETHTAYQEIDISWNVSHSLQAIYFGQTGTPLTQRRLLQQQAGGGPAGCSGHYSHAYINLKVGKQHA